MRPARVHLDCPPQSPLLMPKRWRARAQRVAGRAEAGEAGIDPRTRMRVGVRTHAVVVPDIINPFRRSHIFAV